MATVEDLTKELAQKNDEIARLTAENAKLKAAANQPVVPVVTEPPLKPGEFRFSGRVGGPFSIEGGGGFGIGSPNGNTVKIGERVVVATRWKDTSIKGTLPADLTPGPVNVTVGDKTIRAKLSA